ncbi:hypothetical protein M1K46_25245 [Fictibacillus sp. WQ 8-8]|uniref:hypothetical protein n=1 Tax=Fictibacillus sp. WQ 8-8 TaxID=2938788 RepID=UPI00210E4338|nr:hypothetical protein [Fictibacillus sp. WQ 8-8]MCQ6268864.1 hypothetical protein [Fictibacillus sp. WQ 8-8]
MREYVRFDQVRDQSALHKLQQQGWEVFDTAKVRVDGIDEQIWYHVGLPYKTYVKQLQEIITAYEEAGLKEELFKKIAEKNGEEYDDFEEGHGYFQQGTQLPTAKFMTSYDRVVKGSSAVFASKENKEEYEF